MLHTKTKIEQDKINRVFKEYNKDFLKVFDNNLVYCEDTCSFTHRLYSKILKLLKIDEDDLYLNTEISYRTIQGLAFRVLDEMRLDFYEKNKKLFVSKIKTKRRIVQ